MMKESGSGLVGLHSGPSVTPQNVIIDAKKSSERSSRCGGLSLI